MSIKKNEYGLYATDIDGREYTFTKWGAEDSLDTLIDLAQIIGSPLAAALSQILKVEDKSKEESLLDKEINPDLFKMVMEALTGRLDKRIIKPLVKKFASENVFCKGAKINFDDHYRGELLHLFKVVKAGVEVQYGNFLDELKGLSGLVPQGLRNMTQANPTPTSLSGVR